VPKLSKNIPLRSWYQSKGLIEHNKNGNCRILIGARYQETDHKMSIALEPTRRQGDQASRIGQDSPGIENSVLCPGRYCSLTLTRPGIE